MERPVVYSAGLGSTFSMGSLAEGSEPISEVDEIAEVRSLHEKGNRALKVKNYSDAVKFFSDALEIDERNAALLQIRATVYIKMKNYAAAKKDTDILLQINSDNSQAHFLHGVALRHLKKNKDALAAFLIALDLDPEQADELTNHIAATAAGFCEITQELMESFKKMDAYKKMSEIGACLFSSKKYSLCIRILDTAQKFRTNQKGITMRVLLTLANAHSALKHDDQAIGLYQECLAIASSIHDHLYQTKALVNIASINQEIGDQQQAIVHYEKLLDLQAELREEAGDEGVLPEFWSPHLESALHLNLSVAYKMIGNMVDALKHAQEYVELLEKQDTTMQQKAESFYNIGMLNVILGNYKTAIDNYQKFYEESKRKGDKKGISQAYGCLGSAYASLHNWKLALSYHEQDVAMAMKIGDCRMKSHAHEMMGDTLMMKGDHLAAVEAYEAMFKASKDKDTLLVSMALCKQGNAYKALGKHQYSLFFYEKALALAEASEFEPIRTTCMFKMAQVLLASTQVSDIEQALKYFEKLIPYFELKIQQHKDEASHCEASYYQQLKECYDGAQYALVKVGREKVALQYSEAYRSLSITELENYKSKSQKTPKTVSNMSSMEKLFSYVEQQNSLVLYYSLLPRQLLLWALAPSGEVRRFYCSKVFEEGYLHNQIYSLLSQLTKGHNARDIMTTCENRALPRKHGPLEDVQTENERKSSKKNTDSLKTGQDKDGPEMEDLCKNKDAARQLYNLLLGPIDDVLSGLKPGSPITIIPDKILSVCPFGSLKDWHGKYLYENFSLVYLPCILCVNIVTKNEQECLKCQDELEFRRSQSRYSSINKHQLETMLGNYSAMTTPENTSYETVNPKRIGNPGLLKSGRCPLLTTTTTPQGQVLQKLLRSPQSFPTELTYHSVSPTQGGERKTAGDQTRTQTKTVGGPSSLSRLLQYHSLSTLTAHTSTGTDITRSDQMVTRYQQISDQDRCLVIGNPNLPDRLQLNGRTWNVGNRLTFARKEVDFVASYMDVDAITDTDATKDRFLSEIGNATVIHIVSYACWEEGFVVMTPSDLSCLKGDIPEEKSYVVTTGDIVNTTMRAQLVVLSCGWSPYRKHLKQTDFKLAGAFLAAGCQCVLQTMWALPNNTMEVFLYHFYFALQSGCLLSAALSQAVLALRQDERSGALARLFSNLASVLAASHDRFGDPFYWSAFVLIGKDVRVDLLNIRHAMLDQRLDHTEAAVQAETDVELLNPKLTPSQVSDKDELLQQQQKHLVRLLHDNHNQPDVIPSLIDLLDESLKRLHTSDNNNYVTRLTVAVGNSTGALDILHMLGFHFQGKEADVESPFVIYPHWNPHDLLVPCYDALKALSDLVKSADCVQALCDLLPLTQDVISHLIDLISITKHAPEIQLKVSDLSVRPLWVKSKVKALLLALGFHQIGMLLVFSNVPDNRRLLTATLQLLLSVSSQKSQVLLYRLDVSLLGKPPPTVNTMGGESWKLPSLGPVLLHKDQLRLSTPWMSVVESPDEMDTKMSLAKRKRATEGRFSRQCDKARSWHQITVSAQANQTLDKIGRPKTSPAKVKVKPGSSASRPRVPVDLKPTLDIPATGQRRDYAHFILNERVEKVAKDGIAEVKRLYLPYVQAS